MIKYAVEAFSLVLKKVEPNTKYAPGSPFIELEKLPGVVLEGPVIVENRKFDSSRIPQYISKGENFIKLPGSKYYDLDFTLTIIADKQQELMRMLVDLTAYFTTIIDIVFPKEDPQYSCHMRIVNGFSATNTKNISGICEAKATLRIESVPMLSRVPIEIVSVINAIDIEIRTNKEGSVIDGTRIVESISK